MSKYPYILFYSFNIYNKTIEFLKNNSENLNCSIYFINENEEKLLKCIYNNHFNLLITYGNTIEEYENIINKYLDKEKQNIYYYHLYNIKNIEEFNEFVNNIYIINITLPRKNLRPIFSIFTTTFNSFDKIKRCYNSIINQTFKNWEWVIIDDSPNDTHFSFLKDYFENDENNEYYHQIRIYRRSQNSGNIGNVKNEAISLCRGIYVLELDHDDIILPHLLEDSYNTFNNNNTIDFIYSDFANIYENEENFYYGDFVSKGYAGYYMQFCNYIKKWVYVFSTPNINNITLSHIVSVPNHPRIWKREKLLEIGNYCEYLPICDDYEILLLTALKLNCAKIHKLSYIQFMNNNNNNFSLILNSEINRLCPLYIYPIYYKNLNIHKIMKIKNAYEDEFYIENHSQIWKRKNYIHKFCNKIINVDYKKTICIIGLDSLEFYINKILDYITYNNNYDFFLIDNNYTINEIIEKLNIYANKYNTNFNFFKFYILNNETNNNLINYFYLIYLSTKEYEILNIRNL